MRLGPTDRANFQGLGIVDSGFFNKGNICGPQRASRNSLMIEATIPVGSADELVMLLGASDQHLRRIRDSVPAKISARDGKIHVSGDEQAVLQATEIIEQIKNSVSRDGAVSPEQVNHIIRQVTGAPINGRP